MHAYEDAPVCSPPGCTRAPAPLSAARGIVSAQCPRVRCTSRLLRPCAPRCSWRSERPCLSPMWCSRLRPRARTPHSPAAQHTQIAMRRALAMHRIGLHTRAGLHDIVISRAPRTHAVSIAMAHASSKHSISNIRRATHGFVPDPERPRRTRPNCSAAGQCSATTTPSALSDCTAMRDVCVS